MIKSYTLYFPFLLEDMKKPLNVPEGEFITHYLLYLELRQQTRSVYSNIAARFHQCSLMCSSSQQCKIHKINVSTFDGSEKNREWKKFIQHLLNLTSQRRLCVLKSKTVSQKWILNFVCKTQSVVLRQRIVLTRPS